MKNNSCILVFDADPFSYLHLDLVKRALRTFNRVVVLITTNANKKSCLLSFKDRDEIAKYTIREAGLDEKVEVYPLDMTLPEKARHLGITTIVRTIRDSNDLRTQAEFEAIDSCMDSGIETLYMLSDPKNSRIGTSTIHKIVSCGTYPDHILNKFAYSKLKLRMMKKIAITGNFCCGLDKVSEIFSEFGYDVFDVDSILLDTMSSWEVVSEMVRKFKQSGIEYDKTVFVPERANAVKMLGFILGNETAKKIFGMAMHGKLEELLGQKLLSSKKQKMVVSMTLLHELGYANLFNKTICISRSKEKLIESMMEKHGFDLKKCMKYMDHQMDIDEKAGLSDYVIDNNLSDDDLRRNVVNLINKRL